MWYSDIIINEKGTYDKQTNLKRLADNLEKDTSKHAWPKILPLKLNADAYVFLQKYYKNYISIYFDLGSNYTTAIMIVANPISDKHE